MDFQSSCKFEERSFLFSGFRFCLFFGGSFEFFNGVAAEHFDLSVGFDDLEFAFVQTGDGGLDGL